MELYPSGEPDDAVTVRHLIIDAAHNVLFLRKSAQSKTPRWRETAGGQVAGLKLGMLPTVASLRSELKRETKEETGLEVAADVPQPIVAFGYAYDNGAYHRREVYGFETILAEERPDIVIGSTVRDDGTSEDNHDVGVWETLERTASFIRAGQISPNTLPLLFASRVVGQRILELLGSSVP